MSENKYDRLTHTLEPICDERSRVLILGSFPSVKSRESGFYYGHPRNRFWKMLAGVFSREAPTTTEQKIKFLLECNIALWDVVGSCEISGSSDASIKNVEPNDIGRILNSCRIEKIIANGLTAAGLYKRYCEDKTGREIIAMPSTSPANAALSLDELISRYKSELIV
ncbi:MAG: DNA-deoxyinosine glycosylase [Oscillospiraceae bacterium]